MRFCVVSCIFALSLASSLGTAADLPRAVNLDLGEAPPAPFQITVGGQHGWQHDGQDASGYFHTFDALSLPGPYQRTRKLHVYLPRSYALGEKSYPVIYMNDGSNAFFTDNGQGSWHLQDHLTALYQSRAIPEVIVVGIVSPDRNEEYTHAAVPTVATCCRLPDYSQYVAHQLKPWIDVNYRTIPDAAHTAVIGSSHGGLAAFAIAAEAPMEFGMVAALSPSFWVDMTPFGAEQKLAHSKLVTWLEPGLKSSPRLRVYIDWGLVRTGGMENSLIEANAAVRGKEMAELLQADYGYQGQHELTTVEDPIGDHSEVSWGRRIEGVLTWMWGNP